MTRSSEGGIQIIAFGKRRFPNGEPNPGAPHAPIPIEAVIHPSVRIELWNQLAIDSEADITAWNARRGMAFDDVRFKTADILRLWPSEQSSPLPDGLPVALANDPKVGAAFDEMCRYAREQVNSHGRPPKRDDVAQIVSRKTGYAVRKARDLYSFLPDGLRNPARTKRP